MDTRGLTEAFGHLSTRLENDRFLMTPAVGPGMAEESDLVVIDCRGKRILGSERPLPLERFMHLAIYDSRPDVQAICRTHSPACVSWGATGKSLPMAHGFGWMLGKEVTCLDDIDLVTSRERARSLVEQLAGSTALLLRGNGAIATGVRLQDAVVHAIYLEEAARIVLDVGPGNLPAIGESDYKSRLEWHANELPRAWEYFAWKAGCRSR